MKQEISADEATCPRALREPIGWTEHNVPIYRRTCTFVYEDAPPHQWCLARGRHWTRDEPEAELLPGARGRRLVY